MHTAKHFAPRNTQSGAVLAIALIMLLVLTLLGTTGMQNTIMEERMASNTRDRSIAFQAAESAIRDAETYLQTIVTTGAFNGSAGLFANTQAEPNYQAAATWNSNLTSVAANNVPGSAAAPRYFIKRSAILTGVQGALNIRGYANNKGTGDVTTFRITSRGMGANADSSEVILRSYFGRQF